MLLQRVDVRFATETGAALIVTLMMMLLLSGLALSLTLACLIERNITRSYGDGMEALYAADAAIECVIGELAGVPNWSRALDGTVSGIANDGPAGIRILPDGSRLDLTTAAISDGPWGANNRRWQLFASAPLPAILGGGVANPDVYTAVWVSDDERETDASPLDDENGTIVVVAHAYGRRRVRRAIEATIARVVAPEDEGAGQIGVRVLSWREVQ